jgi:hypothetical protein
MGADAGCPGECLRVIAHRNCGSRKTRELYGPLDEAKAEFEVRGELEAVEGVGKMEEIS